MINTTRRGVIGQKRWLAAAVLLTLSVPLSADQLWDLAVEVAANNRDWLAREIRAEAKQYNRNGSLVGEGLTVVLRSVDPQSGISVAVEESGSDPPDAKNVLSGGLGTPAKLAADGGVLEIFDASRKTGLSLRRASAEEMLPGGARAAVYRFTRNTPDRGRVDGTVWIDVSTGVPVKLMSEPQSPPPPLDKSESVIHFNASPSAWYPVRVETTGEARRAMVQRRVSMNVVLLDYVRYSQ